jgi:hypothetical protein
MVSKQDLNEDPHLPTQWLADWSDADLLSPENRYDILSAMDEAGAEKRPQQTIGALRIPTRHPRDIFPFSI